MPSKSQPDPSPYALSPALHACPPLRSGGRALLASFLLRRRVPLSQSEPFALVRALELKLLFAGVAIRLSPASKLLFWSSFCLGPSRLDLPLLEWHCHWPINRI